MKTYFFIRFTGVMLNKENQAQFFYDNEVLTSSTSDINLYSCMMKLKKRHKCEKVVIDFYQKITHGQAVQWFEEKANNAKKTKPQAEPPRRKLALVKEKE
jgi:hypothetical protein